MFNPEGIAFALLRLLSLNVAIGVMHGKDLFACAIHFFAQSARAGSSFAFFCKRLIMSHVSCTNFD
jgi:hypothetical protein